MKRHQDEDADEIEVQKENVKKIDKLKKELNMTNQKFADESKLKVEILKKVEQKIVSTLLVHTQASEIPKFEYSEHKKE